MNKDTNYFGIDISKDVFDVYDEIGNFHQFKNNYSGFKKYAKLLGVNSHCVMEATGYYHYKLAYFFMGKRHSSECRKPVKNKTFHSNGFVQG